MSRIGNKPITVPEGVEVTLNENVITVKGPKGTLVKELHKNINVALEGNVINVTRPNDEPYNRSLHGLTRTLINNMIVGVKDEYKRELDKKLIEEVNEIVEDHSAEEIGDLLEVILAVMKEYNISEDDVKIQMEKKRKAKGSFDNKIYLISVEE